MQPLFWRVCGPGAGGDPEGSLAVAGWLCAWEAEKSDVIIEKSQGMCGLKLEK